LIEHDIIGFAKLHLSKADTHKVKL